MNFNLVLSGGGTRGYAHIGVLKAFLEKGISIGAVSGSSCGAIIGAFFCDGFHPAEIEEILLRDEPEVGINYRHFWQNLLSFDSYATVLKKNLRSKRFDTLQKPLHVSVTNLLNGQQEVLSEGSLFEALVATAAIPVLFPSCIIDGVPYADGGISSNLPVEPFLSLPEQIIGVHANPISDFDPGAGLIHRIDRSLHLLMRNSVTKNRALCHLFLEPQALRQHHLFESKRTCELIRIGYEHVMQEADLSAINY